MTTVLLKLCTLCEKQGKAVPAKWVAVHLNKQQWYQCDDHPEERDVILVSSDDWLKMHFPNAGKK